MSERYKKEIEEILQQAGELNPKRSPGGRRPGFLRLVWLHLTQSLGGKTWSLSPGRVMLIGLVLLLSALISQAFVAGILAWTGLILLIVGYGMFFIRPPRNEKRWRGQQIDYGGDSWWDRLRRRSR
jgi:hypothetical protein